MKKPVNTFIKTGSLFVIIAIVFSTGCQQQPDYSKDLKPLIDTYFQAWQTGNVDELDTFFDPNFVRHADLGSSADNLEELKKVIKDFKANFPDAKLVSEEEIFTENKFSGRWSFTGTSTGISVSQWGVNIIHFKDGKIVEEWDGFDNAPLLEKLGYTITPPSEEKN
jgi:ketosteroid isomerase-like protein